MPYLLWVLHIWTDLYVCRLVVTFSFRGVCFLVLFEFLVTLVDYVGYVVWVGLCRCVSAVMVAFLVHIVVFHFVVLVSGILM